MLDYTGFKNEFITLCRQKLDESAFASTSNKVFIEEHTVKKAQYGELTGLIFRTGGSTCSPTIYVEDFFRMYKSGLSVDDLSLAALANVVPYINTTPDFPENAFEDAANLRVRLLNSSRNREYLKSVPHIDSGCGLALIAEVRSGEFRAVVTDGLLDSMEISRDELFETALENSAVEEPPVLYSLPELLEEGHCSCRNYLNEGGSPVLASDITLYMLSNKECFRGAAVLFYPGMTAKLCELLGGAFYVLPSSVHELLLLPVAEGDPQKLGSIISSANRTVVSDDDYLSDDLFICEAGTLRKISFK